MHIFNSINGRTTLNNVKYKNPILRIIFIYFPVELQSKASTASYTAIFYNAAPYPIDVVWISFQGEEVTYQHLVPGAEYPQQTYLNHLWVFKTPGHDLRLMANANGVTKHIFEGTAFGAQENTSIRVTINKL